MSVILKEVFFLFAYRKFTFPEVILVWLNEDLYK